MWFGFKSRCSSSWDFWFACRAGSGWLSVATMNPSCVLKENRSKFAATAAQQHGRHERPLLRSSGAVPGWGTRAPVEEQELPSLVVLQAGRPRDGAEGGVPVPVWGSLRHAGRLASSAGAPRASGPENGADRSWRALPRAAAARAGGRGRVCASRRAARAGRSPCRTGSGAQGGPPSLAGTASTTAEPRQRELRPARPLLGPLHRLATRR